MYQPVQATHKVFQLQKRIRAVAGGTSASKTISILIWLIDYSQSTKNKLSTITSESYPHLEGGAIRDFKNIMKASNYWKNERWNETKHYYTFETGSVMEFVSMDNYGKAHGPRRDVLFLNECNNLAYQTVDQLIIRTREIVWMDWNPTSEFWFYTEFYPNRKEDTDFITLTYKDNEALDETTIREIEAHKNNKNWWTVYGEGQLGAVEGRVYKDWQIIDEIPHEARLERRGLDYGYTNDPSAIVAIYYLNGGYILDEEMYQKGMNNKPIADFILNLPQPNTLVRPDNAEPKSNDELKGYGVNLIPAAKGPGSIKKGIDYVQSQRISVTKRSLNLIKEYRSYMFQTDKNGVIGNDPEEGFDHCMDAIRYGFEDLRQDKPRKQIVGYTGGDPVTGFGRRPIFREALMP